MSGYLELQVLGDLRISYRNNPIYLGSKKGIALLCLLIFSPNGTTSRERLKLLLWGDVDEKRAQSSLRYTTWKVSRALEESGYTGFTSSRQNLSIDIESVRTNIDCITSSTSDFLQDIQSSNLPRQFDEFLYELSDISVEFSDWIAETKNEIKNNIKTQVIAHSEKIDLSVTDKKLQSELLLAIDPLNEPACRQLMLACSSEDDTAGALAAYQNLYRTMDEQQGMEPSESTQELAVEIKLGKHRTNRTDLSALTHAHTLPLIMVGEIQPPNITSDSQFIVSGFRHELIACLIRFREWTVCDAGATFDSYRPNANSIYSLNLSAFEVSDRFRLVVTLKNYSSDTYLWSEQFHTSSKDWLKNQSVIVRRLSMSLNVQLNTERLNQIKTVRDFPLAVYDRWLLAQESFLRFELDSWESAKNTLIKLTIDHPRFARAYSTLSQLENSRHLNFPGLPLTSESKKNSLKYATEAVRLDNMDSRNQLCLGWSYAMNDMYEQSELAFYLAHEINENDQWALISSAMGLAFCGDHNKAMNLAKQAELLSPAPSPDESTFQANIAFLCEDFHRCVKFAVLAGDKHADLLAWHAAALAHLGEIDAASAKTRQFVSILSARWFGSGPPSERDITAWIVRSFPIRDARKQNLLLEGLSRSGLTIQHEIDS